MNASMVEAPQLMHEEGTQGCFIPKVCVHAWTGHTQGLPLAKTFSGMGNMFLSGTVDTKIKIRHVEDVEFVIIT
jgi:pre-mRNA-processing factor 17